MTPHCTQLRRQEEDTLLDLLVTLIEQKKEYRLPEGTPLNALKYLIEANGLKAVELVAERFNVSAAAFI